MLAVIPTVGRSPFLRELVSVLLCDAITVIVIDAHPNGCGPSFISIAQADFDHPRMNWMIRPWPIYRSWNFALDHAELRADTVLVLNDDIILESGSAHAMEKLLAESGFALLAFDARDRESVFNLDGPGRAQVYSVAGVYEPKCEFGLHGLGMFAFAANPAITARCDERFQWWYGDDDLIYSTVASGGRVGIAHRIHVQHPQEGTSSPPHAADDLRPPGWRKHDRALIREKWDGVAA